MTDRDKTPPGWTPLFLGASGLAVSLAGFFFDPSTKPLWIAGLIASPVALVGGLIARARGRKAEQREKTAAKLAQRAAPRKEPRSEPLPDNRTLVVICNYCIDNPTLDLDEREKEAHSSYPASDARLKESPSRFMCLYCASVMTFDPKKIPSGGYTKAAEECSPDRSGIAFFYDEDSYSAIARITERLRRDRKKAAVAPALNPHQKEADLATRLREHQEEKDRVSATLTGTALRDYLKVMDRKRIAILEGEEG